MCSRYNSTIALSMHYSRGQWKKQYKEMEKFTMLSWVENLTSSHVGCLTSGFLYYIIYQLRNVVQERSGSVLIIQVDCSFSAFGDITEARPSKWGGNWFQRNELSAMCTARSRQVLNMEWCSAGVELAGQDHNGSASSWGLNYWRQLWFLSFSPRYGQWILCHIDGYIIVDVVGKLR